MSEMAALTLAGHETTANTLTWLLWELSKQPALQHKLRQEIQEKRDELNERGAEDFSMEDLEGMPFLQALLKVYTSFSLLAIRACIAPVLEASGKASRAS